MSGKRGGMARFLVPVLLAAAAATVFLLRKRLVRILLPLVIGGILFYLLDPVICFLEKKQRMKRGAAIVIVFGILFTVLLAAILFAVPVIKDDIAAMAQETPMLDQRIKSALQAVLNSIFGTENGETGGVIGTAIRKHAESLLSQGMQYLGEMASRFARRAPFLYVSVMDAILEIVTGIIFTYYFLKDKEKIGHWILGIFPYDRRDEIMRAVKEIGSISASFIRGQLLIAFIVGSLETLGVSLLGLPAPWLLGLIGGLSNLIPYIGPFIGAVPSVFAALLVSPGHAVLTVLLFVLVQQLDNNFISPKIIEGKLGIHPVASILAVFAGGEFFGIAGILFAIPVYAILRSLLRMAIEIFCRKNTAPEAPLKEKEAKRSL